MYIYMHTNYRTFDLDVTEQDETKAVLAWKPVEHADKYEIQVCELDMEVYLMWCARACVCVCVLSGGGGLTILPMYAGATVFDPASAIFIPYHTDITTSV